MFLTILARLENYVILETIDKELVFVQEYVGDKIPRSVMRDAPAFELFRHICTEREIIFNWRQQLLGNPQWFNGRWTPLRDVHTANIILQRNLFFASISEGTVYDQLSPRNSENATTAEQLQSAGFLLYRTLQREFCQNVLAGISAFPEVRGFLKHPVYGNPRNLWLRPQNVKIAQNSNFDQLKTLFSALELHPVDHASLYTFFLGCFHAASLDYPRPLLFVDSAMQGRGKGEIGAALSTLLDGVQSSLPITGGYNTVTEDIVSHLVDGCRTMAGQNVSGAADWNNEFLACLATDGNVKKRAKYDRVATPFSGIVGMLSAVYGQASFHQDIVSRVQRVFLRGEAQALDPQPSLYAPDHRDALISEILLAHKKATPYTGIVHTRFAQFEAAGAAAYSVMMELSHNEVSALLGQAHLGARALFTPAIRSLHSQHPNAFLQSPHLDVVSFSASNDVRLQGARALEHIYEDGEWINDT